MRRSLGLFLTSTTTAFVVQPRVATPGRSLLSSLSDEEWSLPPCWQRILSDEIASERHQQLRQFLKSERQTHTVYPSPAQTLRALRELPFADVRVVIVGQDPYHGPGQAHGLSFSVPEGVPVPPSLRNILKELETDIGDSLRDGDLTHWARQGVLLLNSILTVRAFEPMSHADRGWEQFTDRVCDALVARAEPCVFLLWGAKAKAKVPAAPLRFVAPHPSPLSARRGFFGSKPFSNANFALSGLNQPPIQWGTHVARHDDPVRQVATAEPSSSTSLRRGAAQARAGDDHSSTRQRRRVDLRCPYKDKDECKALGGRWDPAAKTWYVTLDSSPQADAILRRDFSRWLPPESDDATLA